MSRRDDLESIAYLLIYLQKGKLPWQGLVSDEKKSKYNKVLKEKKRISIQALCQGLEPEFAELLRYARNLTFSERPNYLYIRGLFDAVMKRKKYEYDNIYQWTVNFFPAYKPYHVYILILFLFFTNRNQQTQLLSLNEIHSINRDAWKKKSKDKKPTLSNKS